MPRGAGTGAPSIAAPRRTAADEITPALAAQIKFWALMATIGGVLSLGGAITCMMVGRPWTGAIVGVLPMLALIGVLVYAQVSRG